MPHENNGLAPRYYDQYGFEYFDRNAEYENCMMFEEEMLDRRWSL